MKIVVLEGSPRKDGNTQIMAEAFAEGAREAGHTVELVDVASKSIAGCRGCKYCFTHDGDCVLKDDMTAVRETLKTADMVVFASPVYWFDLTAQMKAAIDRLYAFAVPGVPFSKVALLLDSGSDHVFDAAIAQYKATVSYLKWEDKGIICIPGMNEKGDMAQNPKLAEVRAFGASL